VLAGLCSRWQFYWEHEEDWSLDTAARLLIVIIERASDADPKATRLIYERR
jgi:hypothetical protein